MMQVTARQTWRLLSRHSTSSLPVCVLCRLPRPVRTFATSIKKKDVLRNTTPVTTRKTIDFSELPKFPAKGKDIQVLYDPVQFYRHLLNGIKHAKKRIFLAALYIGKEETELIESISQAISANPSLEVHLLVDYLRTTREAPEKASSATLLSTLQARHPKQVRVSLYHTPALSGILKRIVPQRYNEGFGLWHGKIYGFDDEVVISGANLSRDYFTNRQDRYMAIRSHPALADYFHSILHQFSTLSFSLYGISSASGPVNFDIRWQDLEARHSNPVSHPVDFVSQAKATLQAFMQHYQQKDASQLSASSGLRAASDDAFDTTIQPFIQMGPFDIVQETDMVVPNVLQEAGRDPKISLDWTSGYFSVRQTYREGLLGCNGSVNIICASPEANGFFQSPGFSKYLPPAYTYMERKFFEEVQRRGKDQDLSLLEWKRPGWTYHAKGIWLRPEGCLPSLTLIGSTNYGYRSAVRDLELNLAIQTASKDLQEALNTELTNIKQHATDKVDEQLFQRPDRYVGFINRWAARRIADML